MMRTHPIFTITKSERKKKINNYNTPSTSTIGYGTHPKSHPCKAKKSKLSPYQPGPTKKAVVLDPSTVGNDLHCTTSKINQDKPQPSSLSYHHHHHGLRTLLRTLQPDGQGYFYYIE
jgi:hypothetical protein